MSQRRLAELLDSQFRFVPLEVFREHGSIPRFGSDPSYRHPVTRLPNANLCVPYSSFDRERTVFIFVTHRRASVRTRAVIVTSIGSQPASSD